MDSDTNTESEQIEKLINEIQKKIDIIKNQRSLDENNVIGHPDFRELVANLKDNEALIELFSSNKNFDIEILRLGENMITVPVATDK